jgi:alkylated DNA repair dioxygenase AlkB
MCAQLTLFESTDTVLTDDERGRIAYTPRFMNPAAVDAWFSEIRDGVDWRALRRTMYEKEVDVPRLIASFRLDRPDRPVPAVLREAAHQVIQAVGAPFNSIGLNRYRDGRDSVAPHNDHLGELVEGSPIALLSLGATRRMIIRAKQPPRDTFQVDLEPGSLLVMSYATQIHYTHGVPKVVEPVGERISLAFRVKPAPASSR